MHKILNSVEKQEKAHILMLNCWVAGWESWADYTKLFDESRLVSYFIHKGLGDLHARCFLPIILQGHTDPVCIHSLPPCPLSRGPQSVVMQVHVTTVDFCCLTAFAPFWMRNDAELRRWEHR